VRMLRISSGESAIAFFQPRDRLSRRYDWLVWMSRISGWRSLICAKQSEYDQVACEWCFVHTAIL